MKKIILIILALLMLGTLVMGQSIVNTIGSTASDTYRVRNGPTDASDLFVVRGSTGNIGMGITSPLVRFHVYGAGVQRIRIQSSDNQAGIEVDGNSADGKWVIYNPQSSTDLRFHNLSAANGNGPRMTIKGNGDVGIGTLNPQGKLDIASTSGALIVPRMTTAQRNVLTQVNGSIIYNTTTNQFNFYESNAWVTK